MLGKLLKYEIRAMGRIMLPLYGAMIFVAGVFALNLRLTMNASVKSLMEKIAIISGFLFFAAILAVGVVMTIMVIQRFYRNLLGNEGYLMFSLPVTTWQHILSKGITCLLWALIGMAAGIAAGFLMVGVVSDVPEFMREMRSAWEMLFSGKAQDTVLMVFVIIFGLMESICKVYAAIAVGHQMNSHRLLASVFAYIGFGVVELIISLPLSSDGMLFGRIIGAVTDTASLPSNFTLWFSLVIALIGIVVYGTLAWYLLDKRLNLE